MTEFRISSFCTLGDCVEVGIRSDGRVLLRDTKDRAGGTLELSTAEWRSFLAEIKSEARSLA